MVLLEESVSISAQSDWTGVNFAKRMMAAVLSVHCILLQPFCFLFDWMSLGHVLFTFHLNCTRG